MVSDRIKTHSSILARIITIALSLIPLPWGFDWNAFGLPTPWFFRYSGPQMILWREWCLFCLISDFIIWYLLISTIFSKLILSPEIEVGLFPD